MPISDKKEKAADRDNSMLELSAERSKVKLKYEAMCAHSIIHAKEGGEIRCLLPLAPRQTPT
jgi:hypothetical protein